MINANITTYIGSIDAEHYYCSWNNKEERPKKHYSQTDSVKLMRTLTSEKEIEYLNNKGGKKLKIGDETERFNSEKEIHEELLNQFPDTDIITYRSSDIYNEMLCIYGGEDYGVDFFKGIFVDMPNSYYKNLTHGEIIIKCEECGSIHKLEDVSEERYLESEQRDWIKFERNPDKCCEYMYLVWNQIL